MAKSDNPAAAGVEHREKVKNEQVAEFYERQANLRPTPSQAENDLARVGALDLDEKEHDGSEDDFEGQRRVMEGKLNNPYETRGLEAGGGGSGEEQPARRGPGRPRKEPPPPPESSL